MSNMDFYFFYGSIHSYLSVMRVAKLAAAARVKVRWQPFNLRDILIEQNNTGFTKNQVKMDYFWRDVERRAIRHKIPYVGRAPYPADPELLALRVGAIAAKEQWCEEYSQVTFLEWFIGGRQPGVDNHVECLLNAMKKPSASIIERAKGAEGNSLVKDATDSARALGIFGAPTFVVDSEIFWGDDRLEDALKFATRHEFTQPIGRSACGPDGLSAHS